MLTSVGDLLRHERLVLMEQCLRLSRSSDCERMKFGAVVVGRRYRDGGASSDLVVVGQGYNRKASPATAFADCCNLRNRLKIPARMRGELCEAIHAEKAAIIDAVERGYQVRGAELAVAGRYAADGRPYVKKWKNFSCTLCARDIKAFGIERVWVPVDSGDGLDWEPMSADEALVTSFEIALELVDLETGARKEKTDG